MENVIAEVVVMGEVVVTIKVMPESPDVDLTQLQAEIGSRIKVHAIEREPIAFGLEALRVITTVPDSAGGTEPLEKTLEKIPGVGSVQVTDVRRAL